MGTVMVSPENKGVHEPEHLQRPWTTTGGIDEK